MKSKTLNLSLTTPTLRDCRCACRYSRICRVVHAGGSGEIARME